ncbi:transglycosylase domain-containing protein [Garciella nitratireducens]|uniref:Penicillin-binding protein 1A n=1 Tax=Garciella nitratireducens DSM 15102 TaxID=1121911 RepID=A0A1T4KQ32_9FIRM|nr:PBP1A family penicillin-binding protein [Garciella nitratireducens]SJZ44447.1 penicillin-binding protein 1A [Garciella nitratireducens DSM 15102]
MKKIKVLLIGFILMIILTGCSFEGLNISDYEYHPKQKSLIYSSDQQLIGEVYNENRTYTELDKIPKDLQKAIIAVEDSRFYSHHGFDPIRIVKSALVNLKEGELEQGGSTITQQVAKNLFLTHEKTFSRKIKEIIYAIQLEHKYSKHKILEIYLNEIYLGQNTYGVQEASRKYFHKNVWELSLGESALIAGLPQAPSAYDPTKHFDRAKNRQEIVLDRMVATGNITPEQANKAKQEKIIIADGVDHQITEKYPEENQHFVRQVVNQLTNYIADNMENQEELSKEELKKRAEYQLQTGGYKIYTTLDTSIQEQAIDAIRNGIVSNGLGESANGALVSIEPSTGKVVAYYGGKTDIDMGKQPRQPGSTIKPLYYAGAMNEQLMDSNTLILDEPTEFPGGYKPKNYGGKYMGYATTREALVHSLNNASVKVMQSLGIKNTMEYLKEYGIDTLTKEDYHLATALGGMSKGITPLDMANAYSIFANDGVYKEAYFIEKVEDMRGNIVYSKKEQQLNTRQVLSENTAKEIQDILTDVVNRGMGKSARLSYYTAGKTGTSNDNKDLWFVGFVKPLATSVWLGNEKNFSLQGGSGISARIYQNYMSNVIKKGLISTNDLEKVTTYDDTIKISILLPDKNINQMEEITEEDITDIVIPAGEISYFKDQIVEKVEIDKKTGKKFVEDHCPEENKEIKIYPEGQSPKEECDDPHIFDKFKNLAPWHNQEKSQGKDKISA